MLKGFKFPAVRAVWTALAGKSVLAHSSIMAAEPQPKEQAEVSTRKSLEW